jgi:nucleoid-associated protein YgaU
MAEGLAVATEFVIEELLPSGNKLDSEQFVWTSAKTTDEGLKGARCCPREAMEIGGKQVLVRTKNPGAVWPSFQVLGPDREPIVLHGVWDDRYNGRGFAVDTMRRFEEMCRRGNKVKVSVNTEGFIGLISDWKFTYRRAWDIGYTFTLSVHSREDEANPSPQPPPVQDPIKIAAGLNRQGDAIAATNYRRPEKSMYGSFMSAVRTGLGTVSDGLGSLSQMLDTKSGFLKPLSDFKAIATQLRGIEGSCSTVINQLVTAKATVQMTARTAHDVVDFEAWSKSMGSQLRLLRHSCHRGAVACDQRDLPPIQGVYRPRKGQSLYSVSQAVYGTPFAWQTIYRANHLTSTTLDGTVVLIIPARSAA